MKTLTEELFQYSVAVSAEEELAYAPVSLNAVLEESLTGFYGVFLGRKIMPEIKMPEHPVTRMADKKAVRRVFDNILNNAAKYSDGDLQILLKPDGTVIFSNHAKKLEPIQAGRLFDRFYTVETAYGSTGIGLSIARLLTEKMGGTINASYIDKKLYVYVKFTNPKDKDIE